MNAHANEMKNHILEILAEMEENVDVFTCKENSFRRKRKFDFSTIMKFILSFGSNTLGHEIGEFFEYQENFPTVSAFVQQRKKLSYRALEYALHAFNKRTLVTPKLFKDYRLLAIDGSDLTLPYNPTEGNVIGTNHVSTLHLNAMYDVCNKRFVDAIVQKGLKENECGAACDLIDRIPDKYPAIIMADRGYENYNLFAHVEERLFDFVIRVKDRHSTGMLSGITLPDAEEFDVTKQIIITRHSTGPAAINPRKYKYLSKKNRFDFIENSKSPDYELSIRFVRFKLTEDTYEVIATSLSETEFSAAELKEIYNLRWGIETGFREVKHVLGLSAFHSKQENSILQEVFARLLMYNYSMSITMSVQPKEKDRRYQLQVNFTQATKICLHFFRYRGQAPPYNVEATILRFVLPIRPDRQRKRTTNGTSVVSFNYRLA